MRRCGSVLLGALLAAHASVVGAEDMDDILGGFEDEDPDFAVEETPDDDDVDRWWDVSGSAELSATVNYRDHRSPTGTDYEGLQRLRSRLNLALDLDLPDYEYFADGKVKFEGWGFYDLAYQINGRSNYTSRVLNEYELDAEFGEVWVQGSPTDWLDVKIGRQVVIWGRSETLRVLDILNPLDNREPGRVDIEDLRRPVGMAKLEGFLGDWALSLIAIPEIRFDAAPVYGSDFFPALPSAPGVPASLFLPRETRVKDFDDSEFAARLIGIFSGWDISFHGAWYWNDAARIVNPGAPNPLGPPFSVPPFTSVHDRLWMVGSGGNYTTGSWLYKYEIAYIDGLGFSGSNDEKDRIDAFFGVEYYGITDTTIVLEGVNRHLFNHDVGIKKLDNVRENMQELALRVTRNFWNDTLHVTLVGIGFGWDLSYGSIVRLDVSYDVMDALSVSGGILLYQNGRVPPLNNIGLNDRLIFSVKYSF